MASQACRELPPVEADYSPKGTWEEVGGQKTYIIGPQDAKSAIIFIYDIFGVAPQTLQGADRLAAHTGLLVVQPDFLKGSSPDSAWFPMDSDEKKAAFGAWRKEHADTERVGKMLLEVRKAVGERWPAVDEHVGVFGLCWGGKIAVEATGAGNEGPGRRFTVSGTAHPGGLDAKDAEALTAAHLCLASEGEPQDVVAQYKEILAQPGKTGHVETIPGSFHGWMGARANLKDEKNVSMYEKGYKQVAEFYLAHL